MNYKFGLVSNISKCFKIATEIMTIGMHLDSKVGKVMTYQAYRLSLISILPWVTPLNTKY